MHIAIDSEISWQMVFNALDACRKNLTGLGGIPPRGPTCENCCPCVWEGSFALNETTDEPTAFKRRKLALI